MTDRDDPFDATFGVLSDHVHSQVKRALNRTQVWLDHPSFDSKADVLKALDSAFAGSAAIWGLWCNNDRALLWGDAFDIDWDRFRQLRAAVKALGTKSDQGHLTRTNLATWRTQLFLGA